MNEREHLLTCLAEESSEIITEAAAIQKACSKALRFGESDVNFITNNPNVKEIVHEFIDLLGVMELLYDEGVLERPTEEELKAGIKAKKDKVRKYIAVARRSGTVKDDD